jgi:hypothetical protein
MKSINFIILLLLLILIISIFSSTYKRENMMEFVEPPSGVLVTNPQMQLTYCSPNKNLKNLDIKQNAKCYPYKCINKRGKITCRNEPCWIDEVYYNGEVECGGEYKCDNTYNKNYDCSCKNINKSNSNYNSTFTSNKQTEKTKQNKIDNDNNTVCIDPCTYRYYATDDYPCDVHYIQATELEPDMINYGNKVCLINDNYDFKRRKQCKPLEVELLNVNI